MPNTIEDMLLSAVKIDATYRGKVISTGTGFFWLTTNELGQATSIITNKHVLDHSDGMTIYMHIASSDDQYKPSGKAVQMNIPRGKLGEFPHPRSDVDLIAINVSSLLLDARADGITPCLRALNAGSVPTKRDWELFDAVEDVMMFGFPRGISDEYNNMPLVRRGITATSVKRDFNGTQEFMVDLACFPGSSGSPVVYYNQTPHTGYRQNDGTFRKKPAAALLGILHAGPVLTNEGRIVLNQEPTVLVNTMMHLGQVIRATRLLEIDVIIDRAMREFKSSGLGQ